MQGRIVCRDLLESGHSVCMADLYPEKAQELSHRFNHSTVSEVDLREYPQILAMLYAAEPKVVINCAEGNWNVNVYRACLEYGVHVIDLGSDIPATKEQMDLNNQFRKANLTAITGCGSTPGINNIMLYYAVTNEFETVESIEAGFAWDSNIKKFVVPFSIESIIEEFTEPAPIISNGNWEDRTPLQNLEMRNFRAIGEQASFPVRHPETYTFQRYYKHRGLKNVTFYAGFPDHSRVVIEHYIDSGLGEKKPQLIGNITVRPIDFLTTILRNITQPPGYTETENLWVSIEGMKGNKHKQLLMECVVPTLPNWKEAGCNIDTGFPASLIGQMIMNGAITARGSFAPGPIVPYEPFFEMLKKKQMKIYQNGVAV
jgi:lysine 6-dehydrogenase